MYALIDEHRHSDAVESICQVGQIAPSGDWRHAQRQPERRNARAKRDEHLMPPVERIWHAHHGAYGARKLWRQMLRERVTVARRTTECLAEAGI